MRRKSLLPWLLLAPAGLSVACGDGTSGEDGGAAGFGGSPSTSTASGTPIIECLHDPDDSTAGDCKAPTCVEGVIVEVIDETDHPASSICSTGSCNGSTPGQTPAPIGVPCGVDLLCDGAGHCVGCVTVEDCGVAADCLAFECSRDGICNEALAPVGAPCGDGVCNAQGECVGCLGNFDCPPPEECLEYYCFAGDCVAAPFAQGQSCSFTPDHVCSLRGDCVGCLGSFDCPSSECAVSQCDASGTCVFDPVPEGEPCLLTPGNFCDATGTCAPCASACPAASECATPVCNEDVCEAIPLPAGSACSAGSCDGAGACVECINSFDCDFLSPFQTCIAWACENNACMGSNKPDGTLCGTGLQTNACVNGSCVGCVVNTDCGPPGICCHAPSFACAPTIADCP